MMSTASDFDAPVRMDDFALSLIGSALTSYHRLLDRLAYIQRLGLVFRGERND